MKAPLCAYRDPFVWLIFLLTLSLFLVSMPKTVALEDDSLFILSGYFNGVSHPPGYPLYTLILQVFLNIPIADIPARAHASSAFFAAICCCLLYRLSILLGLDKCASALVALAFSTTATFWSQAIITEVYSLNLALNLMALYLALKINFEFETDADSQDLLAGGFIYLSIVFGLMFANHWPLSTLTLPAYLILIAKPYRYLQNKITPVIVASAITIGFYLYLYLNNQSAPFINFNGRFSEIGDFIDYVMRSHYSGVDQNVSAGWYDKFRFFTDVIQQMIRELNFLIIPIVLGLFTLGSLRRYRLVCLSLTWLVFSNSFALIILTNFDYGSLYSAVFKVYTLVSIAALFLLACVGLSNRERLVVDSKGILLSPRSVYILLAICLGCNLYFSLPQNYRNDYVWGEEYASKILAEIPKNAVVFSDGEIELGLLSYYRFVKKQRLDIQLYSSSGLLLNNRLFDYQLDDKKSFILDYAMDRAPQSVYSANNLYNVPSTSSSIFVDKIGLSTEDTRSTITNVNIELLLSWSANPNNHRDIWTRFVLEDLRQKAISILTPQLDRDIEENLKNYVVASLNRLIQTQGDLLKFLKTQTKNQNEIDTIQLQQQLNKIDPRHLESKRDLAHLSYLKVLAQQSRKSNEIILRARRQGCLTWPNHKNSYCLEPDRQS